jgi:hypothetical protein
LTSRIDGTITSIQDGSCSSIPNSEHYVTKKTEFSVEKSLRVKWKCVITVTYIVNGTSYSKIHTVTESLPYSPYSVGQRVDVYYDQVEPSVSSLYAEDYRTRGAVLASLSLCMVVGCIRLYLN